MLKVFSESIYSLKEQPYNSTFSVESSPNIGNSFTKSCSDWKDGTFENFNDWALKQFRFQKLGAEDEAEVPVDEQKAKDLKFDKNDNDDFILPPKTDLKNIRQKQRVIRGYIGAVYSPYLLFTFFFSNLKHRRFYWLSKGCLPLCTSSSGRTNNLFLGIRP